MQLRGLYQDAIPVDDANQYRSPGYFLADLRAGFHGVRAKRLSLSPYAAVTNVLDRRYNTSVVVNAFGRRFFEPGPGRGYEVGVSMATGG